MKGFEQEYIFCSRVDRVCLCGGSVLMSMDTCTWSLMGVDPRHGVCMHQHGLAVKNWMQTAGLMPRQQL